MKISVEFNRFLHGVVLREIWRLRYLKFYELNIAIRPFYLSFETLKSVLKWCDLDYPRVKTHNKIDVMSYTLLSTKEMMRHLLYIEVILSENNVEIMWLDDEKYKNLKEEFKNDC